MKSSPTIKRAKKEHIKRAALALREIAKAVDSGTISGPHILFPDAFADDLRRRADAIEIDK